MTTAQGLLVSGVRHLTAGGIDGAAQDARVLLAHVLGIPRDRLTLVLADAVTADQEAEFDAAIAARMARQPVAQIIGKRLFYGRSFSVTGDVLDPRPETEELVAEALKHPFETVLDLGTGSGCILLSLLAERSDATGIGADLSDAALRVATQNRTALDLDARAEFVSGSWFGPVQGRFDLIVSNPPYIAADEMTGLSQDVLLWEPHLALTPGGDGLEPYRILTRQAPDHLNTNGRLIVEIGPSQGPAVAEMFRAAGFEMVRVGQDMDGRDRIVCGDLA